VKHSCSSADKSIKSAKAGLDYMYDNFQFVRKAGAEPIAFREELKTNKASFKTGRIVGTGSRDGIKLTMPYNGGYTSANTKAPTAADEICGDALKAQLNLWAEQGVVEPDVAQAAAFTSDYLQKGNSLADVYVVQIGAGSAMGPFSKLLELGANIIALDIPGNWGGPRPSWKLWERLISTAKASPGTLTFPLIREQAAAESEGIQDLCEACGANLMEQPAEITNWLLEVIGGLPKGSKVVIGNYTYLDGELHVKLALAADAVISGVRAVHPETGCAFLCTPTDIHVVPEAAHAAALRNYSAFRIGTLFEKFVQCVTMFSKLRNNALPAVTAEDGHKVYLVDGLSVAQGPNYALAKRMQHWRAQLTYSEGAVASTRIAPSTATISVLHNKTFQWAYFGMPYFEPFEIFKQETTNALMTALLIHDLVNPKASKNPNNSKASKIGNTVELFRTESVHGGLWRSAYQVDSIGETSALVHFCGGPKLFPMFLIAVTVLFLFLSTKLLF